MSRRVSPFQTIRTEGGLIPPDLLLRITEASSTLDGVKPEDYQLPRSARLHERITESWNRLQLHWAEFRNAKEAVANEAATGLTNEKWTLPLLKELDFGILQTTPGPEVNGRQYPISRFYGPTPIHLVGFNVNLDRRTPGVAGAARANPHGLVQEFLNSSENHLWAIVSNGVKLRILRDNQALSRQSFVEFDLETMFDGEVFSDFVIFWLLVHATRFAPLNDGRPNSCWLENWARFAEEQGTRILTDLRGNVEEALQILGQGFTSHPKNIELRESLRTGELTPIDLHGQLMRIVYRLIFLFVAEDRTLDGKSVLHPVDDSEDARVARERYAKYYSTSRLRDMSSNIKGSRHGDLWHQFNTVVRGLSGEEQYSAIRDALALPPFGSFLWDPRSTSALNKAEISNFDFLEAIRNLAFTKQDKILRSVDYKSLGAEELGGVYETLLGLTPQIEGDGAKFSFAEFAGNERKTSGSYYTPDSLVQSLLDSALDPVIDNAVKGKATPHEKAAAILELKVCDPAVGSGHFLVGAAHRLARHLSRYRALSEGEAEPSPEIYQHALREVIGKCLYGVDIDPMSAELCRVGLWIESIEPGKPLSFLDHHIRVGNSLLGATPQLLNQGIPDDAYKRLDGDDSSACSYLKKKNKGEKRSSGPLFASEEAAQDAILAEAALALDKIPDDQPADIAAKETAFHERESTPPYLRKKLLADAWCSAFVMKAVLTSPGVESSAQGLTHNDLAAIASGGVLRADLLDEVHNVAEQHRFFHWQLAFPEVFANGGFDCVLGNPPWERVKLQEKEWFSERSPEIANASNADARKRLIRELANDEFGRELLSQFQAALRLAEDESHFLRNSARYPLCGRGDINLYTVFAEGMRNLLNRDGRVGCVLPTGIATDDTTKYFFQNVIETNSLVSLLSFENEEFIFPEVHHATRFCLFTVGSGIQPITNDAEFVFFARKVEHLSEPQRRFTLSNEDIGLLNPNTRTCPIFRSRDDAELTKAIYRRVPILIREEQDDVPEKNPWGVKFSTMFHMSNDSHLFRTRDQMENDGWTLDGNVFRRGEEQYLPLYEAKMIHHFDHRWGTYEGQTEAQARQGKLPEFTEEMHDDPDMLALPRYWVEAREVYLASAPLPNGLLQARRDRNQSLIVLGMTHLLFGKWLQEQNLLSNSHIEGGAFPAWERFVDRYPFARDIAPTSVGLCGENGPCIDQIDENYLPAMPIDQIVSNGHESTAWYKIDPKSLKVFEKTISNVRLDTDLNVALQTSADVIAFAEVCLEAATPKWFLGFRDITGATVFRTVISTLIPRAAVGNNLPLMLGPVDQSSDLSVLAATLSSFACDFASRFKVGGTHLNFFIAEQIPVLSPELTSSRQRSIVAEGLLSSLILELNFTSMDHRKLASELGFFGSPFSWNSSRRQDLRCELDALFFHLYLPSDENGNWKPARIDEGGVADETDEELAALKASFPTPRDAVAYMMDTFPIVRDRDIARTEKKNADGEIVREGTYITKDAILEIYDAMQEAIRTGIPYQTPLSPPPADPSLCHVL